MSFMHSVMKDITHYFRPSSSHEEKSNTLEGEEEITMSGSYHECNEDSNVDELYSAESDGDSDFTDLKKKSHLVVQVPGVNSSEDTFRKRKRNEQGKLSRKRNKTLLDSCTTPKRNPKLNCENENFEESYYMSPLRLESDTSPDASPSSNVTSVYIPKGDASLFHRSTLKKEALLTFEENAFTPSRTSKNDTTLVSQEINKSSTHLGTPSSAVNDVDTEKEIGSIYKYFESLKRKQSQPEGDVSVLDSKNKEHLSHSVQAVSSVIPVGGFVPPELESTETDAPRKRLPEGTAFSRIMASRDEGGNSPVIKFARTRANLRKVVDSDLESGPSNTKKTERISLKMGVKSNGNDSESKSSNNLLNYFNKTDPSNKSKTIKGNKRGHLTKKNLHKNSSSGEFSASQIEVVNDQSSLDTEVSEQLVKKKVIINSKRLQRLKGQSSLPKTSCPLKDDDYMGKSTASSRPGMKNFQKVTCRHNTQSASKVNSKNAVIGVEATPNENYGEDIGLVITTIPKEERPGRENTSLPSTDSNFETKSSTSKSFNKDGEGSSVITERREVDCNSARMSADLFPLNKSNGPRKGSHISENQRTAAALVRRACRNTASRARIQAIKDPHQPSTSGSSSDIIILSEKIGNGKTKEIVIRPSYVKLAPLFSIREEFQKKKCFLQSGTPDILVRRMEKQRRLEVDLAEASKFPCISHTLQNDSSFPWCLEKNPIIIQNFSRTKTDLLKQEKILATLPLGKLKLGDVSSLPAVLSTMLLNLRPPLQNISFKDCSSSTMPPEVDEDLHCFCVGLSSDIPEECQFHEFSSSDIEIFERVHAWLIRSFLPPGLAFKMCVDLSSFMPHPSPEGFSFDHISAVPIDSPHLRKEMLLKIKEDYPGFPVYRSYKNFFQRRKYNGGLYSLSDLHCQDLIILDLPPGACIDGVKCKEESKKPSEIVTPRLLRRSERSKAFHQSTPLPGIKMRVDSPSVSGDSCLSTFSGVEVMVSSSSLLTSESWANIFAPTSYHDACSLGRNLRTLEKLQSWLESWKKKSSERVSRMYKHGMDQSDSEEECSSGIEFCSSDDDETKKIKNLPTNVAILIGPCGSGKTSSVYALTKEMGYKVLEINASSKRSGKYILAAVKEATRSYQVLSSGGVKSPNSIGSYFKKTTPNASEKRKTKIKTKKDVKSSDESSSAISVIFVEDVDVIFENEDEGFIGALTSLTTSTKRPVILEVHTSRPLRMGTTNNWLLEETLTESCPHLINFLARQNRTPLILPFERSQSNLNAEALLRVACLSEGVWVGKQWSEYMFKHTAGDFRRAIQEAQFWAGSVARSALSVSNLSRYAIEMSQKSEMEGDEVPGGLAAECMPSSFCGCVRRRACSYPYMWMYNDYVRHLWLKLDQVVDAMLMEDDAGLGNGRNATLKHQNCQESCQILTPIKEEKVDASKIKLDVSSSSLKVDKSLEKNLTLSCPNDVIKVKMPSKLNTMGLPCIRRSPRLDHGMTSYCCPRSNSSNEKVRSHSWTCTRKIDLTSGQEDGGKFKNTEYASENTNEMIDQKLFPEIYSCVKKRDIAIFSNYLDLLCTSDMFLKKFNDTEGSEQGRFLVYEMGTLSKLIGLSMDVFPSEKSRNIEAKQTKDSSTAAQYQMILPIMPNYWILNSASLAMDVAPHIRETCRILDELTKIGKARTRMSHRLPAISRVGPALREALCKTLVDEI